MSAKLNKFLAGKLNLPIIYKLRWLIAILFVTVVATFDFLSGALVTLSAFYLIPVIFIAWYQSRTENQILTVYILGAWGLANYSSSPDSFNHWMIIWNTLVRWIQLTIFAELFHRVSISYTNQRLLAEIDSLTNLPNRRYFWVQLVESWSLQLKTQPFKLLAVIDVDQFKQINDIHGHGFGDVKLQEVAAVLNLSCSENEFCGRLGGDEFAIFMRGKTYDELKLRVEQLSIELKNNASSCSIGAIVVPNRWRDAHWAIESADFALYETKRNGRGYSTTKFDDMTAPTEH